MITVASFGLSRSGWANAFYSAAAQAGAESWKAWFFGSSDAANAITVDKPPAALWPMALSVRLFGLGAWQILVPQALMGVATTAVLYASVRRQFGPGAALLSGMVFDAMSAARNDAEASSADVEQLISDATALPWQPVTRTAPTWS